MKIINPNTEGIKEAVKKILEGGIIFIPTDTVYGIAANPYNDKAIKKIFSIPCTGTSRNFDYGLLTMRL